MNLVWALRRLSAMSVPEIGYRVRQRMRALLEQYALRGSRPPAPAQRASGRAWVQELPRDIDAAKYVRAAEEILAGRFRVFAMPAAQLGFPPRWNQDPKTGVCAPLAFGKSLDYRDERLVGDIKYLWEPSRHAELVTLAQAWHLTREPRYAQGCRVLLESWFEQCPWPLGPHWTSSLEHAIRLINWSFAWHLLGADRSALFEGESGEAFRARWLASIYRHCEFIANHFSRYSSANNHLLGELTGLFVASVTWPLWTCSARWRALAHRQLEREALQQNFADGMNKEQADWYHQEVADMLLLAGLVAHANGCEFGAPYWQRLRAMLDYLASVMDAGGHVPGFGDADDAVIARLDPDVRFDAYRSLLAVGATLWDSPELKHKAEAPLGLRALEQDASAAASPGASGSGAVLCDKARWLLGDSAGPRYAQLAIGPEIATMLPLARAFPEGGIYILGDRFETPQEVRIVADAGPLGYLSIAAHGHADALSFVLSAGGRELLIDPGTFAYHTQRRWRDYFRGTAAHNTIRVDRQDQSVSGGNFLWSTHARTRVIEFCAVEQRLSAEHDGYLRLQDPLRHRRELRFEASKARLTVIDDLLCQDAHEVELFWHFAACCRVEHGGCFVRASNGPASMTMIMPAMTKLELLRGSEDPPLGWVSRSFDRRVPAPTLRARCAIRGNTRLVTTIEVRVDAAEAAMTHEEREERGAMACADWQVS